MGRHSQTLIFLYKLHKDKKYKFIATKILKYVVKIISKYEMIFYQSAIAAPMSSYVKCFR